MNILCILIFGLLIAVVFVSEARGETFETLVYTPPTGWTKQVSPEKTVYQRKSGVGAIIFYAGYQTNGSAADEFAKIWCERLEPTLAVKPPSPQIERENDFAAAIGAQTVNFQDALTTAVLTVFVGRGRAIGVVSFSAGDDVLREVTAFFDSLKSAPATSAAQANLGAVEFDYRVPTGLTAKNDGQMILLTPTEARKRCLRLLAQSAAPVERFARSGRAGDRSRIAD